MADDGIAAEIVADALAEERRESLVQDIPDARNGVIGSGSITDTDMLSPGSPAREMDEVALMLELDNSFWQRESDEPIDPADAARTRPRKKIYYHKSLYWIALISITWSFGTFVRAPSIVYQLCGYDKGDEATGVPFNLWLYLIPLGAALICIGWPVMIAEAAMGQIANGGAVKVFGSINLRTRALGTSFILAVALSTFMPIYGGLAFGYMIRTKDVYQSKIGIAGDGTAYCAAYPELEGYTCQIYQKYSTSPTTETTTLPVTEPANAVYGVGMIGERRLLSSVPADVIEAEPVFGTHSGLNGYSGHVRSMHRRLDDSSDDRYNVTHCHNSYSMPFYCAYAHFIEMSTGYTLESQHLLMVTTDDDFDHSGNVFIWPVMVGIMANWILACVIACIGPKYSQWVRLVIMLYVLCMVLAVVSKTCIKFAFDGDPAFNEVWRLMRSGFDAKQLKRPELWSIGITQALLVLGIAQGILPDQQTKSAKNTQNTVVDQSIHMFCNTAMHVCMVFLSVMLGAGFDQGVPSTLNAATPTNVMGQVAHANPMSEIFALSTGAFGQWGSPNGWSIPWFLMFFLISVNTSAAQLESIITGFAGQLGVDFWHARTLWGIAWACMMFGCNMILSFSCGYPFSTLLGHITIDFFLVMMAYLQVLAIGWILHFKKNLFHLGKWATWVHIILYHLGCWTAGICTGLLYHSYDDAGPPSEPSGDALDAILFASFWQRYIGVVIGAVLMVLSVIIPPFIAHKCDGDNKPESLGERFSYVFWGNIEQLRHQINLLHCFHTKFWRLTPMWSVLIKYVAPFGCAFAFSIPICSVWQLWDFSAYYPFLYDSAMWHQWSKGYDTALAMDWIYQFCACVIPGCTLIWVLVAVIVPWMMHYCTPTDAKELIYDPLDAVGNVAYSPFTQLTPDEPEMVAGGFVGLKEALLEEKAMKEGTDVSSVVSSIKSDVEHAQKKAEKERKKRDKEIESELSSMQSDADKAAKKAAKERKKQEEELASEASSRQSDAEKAAKKAEKERQKEIEKKESAISSALSELN